MPGLELGAHVGEARFEQQAQRSQKPRLYADAGRKQSQQLIHTQARFLAVGLGRTGTQTEATARESFAAIPTRAFPETGQSGIPPIAWAGQESAALMATPAQVTGEFCPSASEPRIAAQPAQVAEDQHRNTGCRFERAEGSSQKTARRNRR